MTKETLSNGILLLYHHPLLDSAPTIIEHINAFSLYSRFKVWAINTTLGFPPVLNHLQFRTIVLHYSIFGQTPFQLNNAYLEYLERQTSSYKIAFFQDEYRYCQSRFDFLNRYKVNCVYTLLESVYFKDVYQKYTSVPKVTYNLTGYVSDDLLKLAQELTKPYNERAIDIGYRARRLAFYMGKGAQEKHFIGVEFKKRAGQLGLKMDIETEESRRIYGNNWFDFLSNCRAVLGVEAGVSIFDIEDKVRAEYERLIHKKPYITVEEISPLLLNKWENNIYYRMISPRHFEAAAFRVCQILFEGKYSGILQPMVHYIPLKKDFSNFDEVIKIFKDDATRNRLIDNAYNDLIASGKYSYRQFIEEFDNQLVKEGFKSDISDSEAQEVTAALAKGQNLRTLYGHVKTLWYKQFPGRRLLVRYLKPLLRRSVNE